MKKALKTAMTASISEVFETMFFMSLEINDQTTLEASGILSTEKTMTCWIGFKGIFSGCFILIIPERLLFDLAESFMGQDRGDITDEHISGTIKEALNMLAGSSLSGFNDKIEFQLTIPEMIDISKATDLGKGSEEEEIVVVTETTEGNLALKAVIESGGV